MSELLHKVIDIARHAGDEILKVYESDDFGVETKGDGSPLTRADRGAHAVIEAALSQLTPDIPLLSEESPGEVLVERLGWERYWLVDPLDGTKEFVKRNGEFTVNIAMIVRGEPVMGVVYTPVRGHTHFAEKGVGAWRRDEGGKDSEIRVRPLDTVRLTMVASRSHAGPAVEQYRAALTRRYGPVETTSMGSSLKLCLIAEGQADIYPRLGPTSEWDTAAADCVIRVAGGSVVRLDGSPLVYNKSNILNPWFLACGDQKVDWTTAAGGIEEPSGD